MAAPFEQNRPGGTGQNGRLLPALDPTTAPVDARTLRSLLEQTKDLCKRLKFHGSSSEFADGDWSGFLEGIDLDDLARYAHDPSWVADDPVRQERYSRPHLSLFLVFLDLLGKAQVQINTLTQRHMDLYFREALRLVERSGHPDRVHVLVQLADRVKEHSLPAGTPLSAGTDALGRPLVFLTDGPVVASHARVAELRSLRCDTTRIGLTEIRNNPDSIQTSHPTLFAAVKNLEAKDRTFILLLSLMLAATPLPDGLPRLDSGAILDASYLKDLDLLLDFSPIGLKMHHSTLRALMDLERQQEDAPEWSAINGILSEMARNRTGSSPGPFEPADDFHANLLKALAISTLDGYFREVPGVGTLDDLYLQRDQPEARAFIRERFFTTPERFTTLMTLRSKVLYRWRQMEALLIRASGRPSGLDLRTWRADTFQALVTSTLGSPTYPSGIRDLVEYDARLRRIEADFGLPVEALQRVRSLTDSSPSWEWEEVSALLSEAHILRMQERRKIRLAETWASSGFEGVVTEVFGSPLPGGRRFADLVEGTDDAWVSTHLKMDPVSFSTVRKGLSSQVSREDREAVLDALVAVLPRPVPGLVRWNGVFVSNDATRVRVQGADGTPRWRTFGAVSSSIPEALSAGRVGLALSSPLLSLSEGARRITLELQVDAESLTGETSDGWRDGGFALLFTTDKGLLAPPTPARFDRVSHVLRVVATLPPGFPPLTPPADGSSPWPMVHLVLADLPKYPLLRCLGMKDVSITVEVSGLASLGLRNDEGPLDARRAFEPFGVSPAKGTRFAFTHPELCSGPLDALTLHFDWSGAPGSFQEHYRGYGPGTADSSPFTSSGDVRADLSAWSHRQCVEGPIPIALFLEPSAVSPSFSLPWDEDTGSWTRFWQLELVTDLQHAAWPTVAARRAAEKPPVLVNPPYAPKARAFHVDYTLSGRIPPGTPQGGFYHLEPFGHTSPVGEAVPLLPALENEGELFIGLEGVEPPTRLDLLFQFAEGSGDPKGVGPAVGWDILDGESWRPLGEGGILKDETQGLRRTGVLSLSLPLTSAGTRMPRGRSWLRASRATGCRGIPDLVAILPHAVGATFQDRGNDPARLARPLPAGSVTGLLQRQPHVKAILQPFSGFGGMGPDQADGFFLRASERVRHRDRALTSWDYERLVLDAFPHIHRVLCLPVGTSPDPRLTDTVQVVVIPDIRGRLPFDPFELRLPANELEEIRDFLLDRCPPFTRIEVKNPTWVELELRVGIRLRSQANPGADRQQVLEALRRFLAPWAYESGAEIAFGRSLHDSEIIQFLEGLPAVDYVATLQSFLRLGRHPVSVDKLPPDAVLVSARSHVIDLIPQEGFEVRTFSGINYMMIGLDFQVG